MVHLEDADSVRDPDSVLRRRYDIATILRTSRWITRGWTLQELIAPKALAFYDQDFSLIGSKSMFCPTIAEVTGIPLSVLRTGDLNQASVAQKMSWAANRKRLEQKTVHIASWACLVFICLCCTVRVTMHLDGCRKRS